MRVDAPTFEPAQIQVHREAATRPRRWLGPAVLALVLAAALVGPSPAWAQPLGGAPVVGLGYAGVRGEELGTVLIGWRALFGAGERFDGWMRDTNWRAAFIVEPSIGGIFGDQQTFEASVLPMLRFDRKAAGGSPYIEAGVGLIYSEVRGIGLGSQINFNDSIGAGWTFTGASGNLLDLGLRVRHISHAGLWADSNKGMNTYFLTFTYQAGPGGY